ncbi:MAG: DUF1800 family protein, partial [Nocardioidaceae bacterium]|nr:DUF1800 family protein [Nocardioidaceae bacterium]
MLAGATVSGAAAVLTGSPPLARSASAAAPAPRPSSGQAVQAELAAIAPYLPQVRPYPATKLPSSRTRQMANRFAYGYTPKLRREMKAAGGPTQWFERQLRPGSIADDYADSMASWFPYRDLSAAQHFDLADTTSGHFAAVTGNHARWTLLRRTYSNRQVHEVMSEFWLN